MRFFDAFFPLGRSNAAVPDSPRHPDEALALMERYDLSGALVFHTVARDGDPQQGNGALAGMLAGARRPELLPAFAFDPTFVIEETAAQFLKSALGSGARAVLLNPLMRRVDLRRSPRVQELAALLEERRIPLLLAHWKTDPDQDLIEWYELSDFCREHPGLPVLAWEWRTRSNRPMFDALARAPNLAVSLSCLWQNQSVAQVCRAFGPERLVFSLGLPHLDPGSFQACVLYADISDEDKARIAAGNLERLLSEADYA